MADGFKGGISLLLCCLGSQAANSQPSAGCEITKTPVTLRMFHDSEHHFYLRNNDFTILLDNRSFVEFLRDWPYSRDDGEPLADFFADQLPLEDDFDVRDALDVFPFARNQLALPIASQLEQGLASVLNSGGEAVPLLVVERHSGAACGIWRKFVEAGQEGLTHQIFDIIDAQN